MVDLKQMVKIRDSFRQEWGTFVCEQLQNVFLAPGGPAIGINNIKAPVLPQSRSPSFNQWLAVQHPPNLTEGAWPTMEVLLREALPGLGI